MSDDVSTIPDQSAGIGADFIDPRTPGKDMRLFKRAKDNGWCITDELRKEVVETCAKLMRSDSVRVSLGAIKVFASLDMVNVNRERMSQADEQGPAVHNTQINLYAGQVVNAQVLLGMGAAERETALSSGAQLDASAIASLTPDEVQLLLRSAQSVPSQLQSR